MRCPQCQGLTSKFNRHRDTENYRCCSCGYEFTTEGDTQVLRCTEAVLYAFGIRGKCPIYSQGLIAALEKKYDVKYGPDWGRAGDPWVGKTLKQFCNAHPRGSYAVFTAGHVMALIDGRLVDTMERGPDRRKIQMVAQVLR